MTQGWDFKNNDEILMKTYNLKESNFKLMEF